VGWAAQQPSPPYYQLKTTTVGLYTIFAHDLPASKLAELSDVSHLTINQLLFKLRTRIAQLCDASSPFSGEVEVGDPYFGGRYVCGKKGRRAWG